MGRYSCKVSKSLLQVTAGWLFSQIHAIVLANHIFSLPYLLGLFFTCTFHGRFSHAQAGGSEDVQKNADVLE